MHVCVCVCFVDTNLYTYIIVFNCIIGTQQLYHACTHVSTVYVYT